MMVTAPDPETNPDSLTDEPGEEPPPPHPASKLAAAETVRSARLRGWVPWSTFTPPSREASDRQLLSYIGVR